MNRRTALQLTGTALAALAGRQQRPDIAFYETVKPTALRLVLDPDIRLEVVYKGEVIVIDQGELAIALKGGK